MARGLWIALLVVIILLIVSVLLLTQQKQPTGQTIQPIVNQPVNSPSLGNQNEQQNQPKNQPKNPETHDITIKNFAFSQSEIRIKRGDRVIWTNMDSIGHTVTSDSGDELNSKLLQEGESYSRIFNREGSFGYYCKPHPYMKARVIVE